MGRKAKANKTGRSTSEGQFAKLTRYMMSCEAWRALPTSAQALYPWLLLEAKGDPLKNGQVSLSVRDAARLMGVTPDTAAKAFHQLMAKGFLIQRAGGCLGVAGTGQAAEYELTELGTSQDRVPKRLFMQWREGQDFPVPATKSNNPKGANGSRRKQKPVMKIVTVLS